MRAAFVLLVLSTNAFAFDYLEHSYLSDRACLEAQQKLAPLVAKDDAQAARYLALSLLCPARWEAPYCEGTYKQAEGTLNLIQPAKQSGDHSVTFGDLSALQDHLAELGAIRGVPQSANEGLTSRVLDWLDETGDAGGVVSDVAEDGCETLVPIRWSALLQEQKRLDGVDTRLTKWLTRSPARKVVEDPAGAYSFDNPQYLDLVLHNHGHFGPAAWRNWAGLHATAHQLLSSRCEDILPDAAKCPELAAKLKLRVLAWSERAAPELVIPVMPYLEALRAEPGAGPKSMAIFAPLVSFVFEGASLHYLQDSLSGGHVRVDRAAYGLYDSRGLHDADSRNGVPVRIRTMSASTELVLFGDGYLLDAKEEPFECDDKADAEALTLCLLRTQRSWVLGASTASLAELLALDSKFVAAHLPIAPPGIDDGERPIGVPPTPPGPLSYQSILLSTSVDAAGGPPQLGVRTVFLTPLGQRANWMTSYHAGILTRLGQGRTSAVTGELAYMFHWRWAARWLINMGPYAFFGATGFGDRVRPILGIGPSVGTSVLPEGWIHLPLEVGVHYRMPVRLFDGTRNIGIEAHWVELTIGLAIM